MAKEARAPAMETVTTAAAAVSLGKERGTEKGSVETHPTFTVQLRQSCHQSSASS
jgi:hypothetical protein